jgi:hypothetical protein
VHVATSTQLLMAAAAGLLLILTKVCVAMDDIATVKTVFIRASYECMLLVPYDLWLA